ncbi:hypothetical protein [Priestia aryabhattai]
MFLFFDLLDHYELTTINKLKTKVNQLKGIQINDIARSLTKSLEFTDSNKSGGYFDLYLGGSLNGHHSFGCRSGKCRLNRINKTGAFSALYSNTSYIPNFFADYHHLIKQKSLDEVKVIFYNDLLIVNRLRKVLEKGYLKMINTKFCKKCAHSVLEKSDEIFTETFIADLEEFYLSYLKGEVKELMNKKVVIIDDDKNILFDHGGAFTSQNYEKYPLGIMPKDFLKETGIIKRYLQGQLSGLRYQYLSSKLLESPFITDSNAHSKFLTQANIANENSKYNESLKQLHFDTPIFEGISLDKVIKLRESEEESFENYRNAIKKSLTTYLKNKDSITPNLIEEFYNDMIQPEIRKLNSKVKNTKSLTAKKILATASVTGMAIGVGLTTNFVNTDILKSLGLFTFLGTTSASLIDYFNTPSDVKSNDYYFLWKVSNL